ncbi:MAG: septum formation initiator family protein [Desulfotomaculaceae bacterium]|nr:septum formation initiator family protein [Desulfotomaculaceae bacterium]
MIVAREKTSHNKFFGQLSQQFPRKAKRRTHELVFKGHKLKLTGLIVAGFLVGLLITYYFSQLFTLGYQISALNKELAVLRVENNNLTEEIQRLGSLDQIEYHATHKLNMVKPEVNNILVVTVPEIPPQESADVPDDLDGLKVLASRGAREKSRLIQVFDELVNQLESRSWLGCNQNSCLWEWANANNKYINSQKNYLIAFYGFSGSFVVDLPSGLAAAC